MVNFELQKAKKKIRQAIDGKYAQKTVATVAAAVGTRHVAIDGNLASATLPDGSSGAVEVINAGRLASARYELRSGGTVSVVSGGGGGSGGGSGGISFSEADTRYYTKSQVTFRVAGSKITTRPGFQKSATMTCLPSTVGNASDG